MRALVRTAQTDAHLHLTDPAMSCNTMTVQLT